MRLKNAGCQREVFAAGAISIMHEATTGALLAIDRPASLSHRKNRKTVERDVVSRIVKSHCLGSVAARLNAPSAIEYRKACRT